MKENEIFFAPSMIINLLAEDYSRIKLLKFNYDLNNTEIKRYSINHFQKHYKQNPVAWIPTIRLIIRRVWEAIILPLNDVPKNIEDDYKCKIALLEKKFRRKDVSINCGMEIFKKHLNLDKQKGLRVLLNVSNILPDQMLKNKAYIHKKHKNEEILAQGEKGHLIIVKKGEVKAIKKRICKNDTNEIVYLIRGANESLGIFEVFTGDDSFFTIKATKTSIILKIPKDDIEKFLMWRENDGFSLLNHVHWGTANNIDQTTMHENINRWLKLALCSLNDLKPFAQILDYLVDWIHLKPGEILYKQESDSNEVYILLDGRTRYLYKNEKNDEKVKEFHRGNKFGLEEAWSDNQMNRKGTMFAIRSSMLSRIHICLFKFILKFLYESDLWDYLIERTNKKKKPKSASDSLIEPTFLVNKFTIRQLKYRKTIAFLQTSEDVPMTALTREIYSITDAYIQGAYKKNLVLYFDEQSLHQNRSFLDSDNEM
uniref:Cyclic nucleotide-binding domain-containing protein n=1 Tax=Acrobeloides nanus TaxID=290746 RepID=A0A914BX43_9BILA